MRLAHELGMHLHQLMGWPGPMTHRQFLAWRLWQRDDLNQPSRADLYAAQTALHAARQNAKHPNRLKLDDFVLRFGGPKRGSRISASESKARWLGHLAPGGIRVRENAGEGEEVRPEYILWGKRKED